MEVQPTPDQSALIREAISSGRLHRHEEPMREALLPLDGRERRRLEILAAIELSKASMARGEGCIVTSHEESNQPASEIGSVDTAIRTVENVSDPFWLLAQQPYMGRRREDLSFELCSFPGG
jgi:hypothetical protein